MSRGLGGLQRRILFVLEGSSAGEGLFPSDLRRELGRCDRSNARRAIRGLISRGLVEEDHGRLAITFRGSLWVHFRLQGPYEEEEVPDPRQEVRERRREVEAALAVVRAEYEEQVRAEYEERCRVHREIEAGWEKSGRSFQRQRYPGPNQLRIIAVLVRYAENPQLGLPKGAVWRIAQGPCDRVNMLRAIRALIGRGMLQQSKDGERLRIVKGALWWLWENTPDLVEPPLDDTKALAILEAFGEAPKGVSR